MRLSRLDSPLIQTSAASLMDMNLHKFCKNLNLKLQIYGAEIRLDFEKSKGSPGCPDKFNPFPDLVHGQASSAATV